MQHVPAQPTKTTLDGLWVLLAKSDETDSERLPVMARSGDDETYLLGFKDVHGARSFSEQAGVENAQPQMVVRGNRGELLRVAKESGASGILVDYDPKTQQYSAAEALD